MKFRPLRADEIEIRIGQIFSTGVQFLLYQDGRCTMNILDETVGEENWQRDHKEIKGNLFCGISICTPTGWVTKWDCGTESYTEKEKGEASDSFKRAAVNWGIGRELYYGPKIFLKCATVPKQNGGYALANPREFVGLYVREVETMELDNKRIITKLVLYQKAAGKDSEVFRWQRA